MTVAQTPLFDPADFRIAPGVCHVCAAGETPFLRRHDQALQAYARDKSAGTRGRIAQDAQVARARELAASLCQADVEGIGLVSSVAEGISMLAESIAWRPGDNVCFAVHEYPSVAAPFSLRGNGAVGVRVAKGFAIEQIAEHVDARTRVIAVSYVSYLSGARADLQGLRKLADGVGAMLVVDFTQAAGYLPVDATIADFAFSACYKWLLGMTGVAIAYWNRRRQPDWAPTTAGWYSIDAGSRPDYAHGLSLQRGAARFTRGNPAHGPVYVLVEALSYLQQYAISDIQQHVQTLTVRLLDGLRELRIPTMTPHLPAHHGASVCIESAGAQQIVDRLYEDGVYAWNGRGRIRFSFHGYNRLAEVDRVLDCLQKHWSSGAAGHLKSGLELPT